MPCLLDSLDITCYVGGYIIDEVLVQAIIYPVLRVAVRELTVMLQVVLRLASQLCCAATQLACRGPEGVQGTHSPGCTEWGQDGHV